MLSREKVEAVLFKMGMPANVKGFGYIVDSVLLLEEDSKINFFVPGNIFCNLRYSIFHYFMLFLKISVAE